MPDINLNDLPVIEIDKLITGRDFILELENIIQSYECSINQTKAMLETECLKDFIEYCVNTEEQS